MLFRFKQKHSDFFKNHQFLIYFFLIIFFLTFNIFSYIWTVRISLNTDNGTQGFIFIFGIIPTIIVDLIFATVFIYALTATLRIKNVCLNYYYKILIFIFTLAAAYGLWYLTSFCFLQYDNYRLDKMIFLMNQDSSKYIQIVKSQNQDKQFNEIIKNLSATPMIIQNPSVSKQYYYNSGTSNLEEIIPSSQNPFLSGRLFLSPSGNIIGRSIDSHQIELADTDDIWNITSLDAQDIVSLSSNDEYLVLWYVQNIYSYYLQQYDDVYFYAIIDLKNNSVQFVNAKYLVAKIKQFWPNQNCQDISPELSASFNELDLKKNRDNPDSWQTDLKTAQDIANQKTIKTDIINSADKMIDTGNDQYFFINHVKDTGKYQLMLYNSNTKQSKILLDDQQKIDYNILSKPYCKKIGSSEYILISSNNAN